MSIKYSFLVIFTLLQFTACMVSKQHKPSFAPNVVVAHRGAFKAMQLPENSIASLRRAIDLKCTGTEFDVWMTTDDSVILSHDPTHQGVDLEKVDYSKVAPLRLSNGEPLPLLRDFLLEGLRNNKQTRLILEIKPSRISKERGAEVARKVYQIVQECGAAPYVTYISFDLNILTTLHSIESRVLTQYLNGDKTPAELKSAGISGLDYHYSVFKKRPDWIREAKQLGLQLNAWTVNDSATMRWLLDEKFDFITTNEPELLLQMK